MSRTASLSLMSCVRRADTLAHDEDDSATSDQVLASPRAHTARMACWPEVSWSCLTAPATSRTAAEEAAFRWKARMQGRRRCDGGGCGCAAAEEDEAICTYTRHPHTIGGEEEEEEERCMLDGAVLAMSQCSFLPLHPGRSTDVTQQALRDSGSPL